MKHVLSGPEYIGRDYGNPKCCLLMCIGGTASVAAATKTAGMAPRDHETDENQIAAGMEEVKQHDDERDRERSSRGGIEVTESRSRKRHRDRNRDRDLTEGIDDRKHRNDGGKHRDDYSKKSRHKHHSVSRSINSDGDRDRDPHRDEDMDGSRRHGSHRGSHGRHSSSRRHRHERDADRHRKQKSRVKSQSPRSRSPSKDKSPARLHSPSPSRAVSPGRSRSRSRSESKRASGFDVLPSGVPAAAGTQAGVAQPGLIMPYMMSTQSMTQQATRHARRVYVGGLPPMVNEQTIAAFFNSVMAAIGANTYAPGDAVVNVYINQEKRFAFVEMRSVEEASNAMALDGLYFNGIQVRVRRPSDYKQEVAAMLGPTEPSAHLNLAAVGLTYRPIGPADGPDRIFVGGLPYHWGEEQVRQLMESFGPLRGLEIVKDLNTGNSKGYGFVTYKDPAATDAACSVLNQTPLGDKVLTVRRASPNGQPKPDMVGYMMQQPVAELAEIPTKVVCLSNALSEDELKDDGEFQEIMEDMTAECGKYGQLQSVQIPRPKESEEVPGLGKVFLEYKEVPGAVKAKCSLDGRKFADKAVVATYYPEHKFSAGDYGG